MTTEQAAKMRNGGQHSYVLASIPVDMIELHEQIRQDWEHDDGAEKMRGLTESIKDLGILQPLLVKANAETGRYRLVVGHRRYKSALEANDSQVPCMIWNGVDEDIPVIQLIENFQRQDLSFTDIAAVMVRLVDTNGWNKTQLASALNVSPSYVSQVMTVFRDPILCEGVQQGLIDYSIAYYLHILHEDYRAPLYSRLRDGQNVTGGDVYAARQRQRQDGVAPDRYLKSRGIRSSTAEQMDIAASLKNRGLKHKEIAQEMEISESKVRVLLGRVKHQIGMPVDSKDSLDQRIRELDSEGMSFTGIMNTLGISYKYVSKVVNTDIGDEGTAPNALPSPVSMRADVTSSSAGFAPAPNYFGQPDADEPIPNAVRSVLPLRTDHPAMSDAPPPAHALPKPGSFFWDTTGEDAWPQVKATTGLKVDIDTRDYLVDAVQTKDTEQAGAPLAPIPPRYVANPTLADVTVLLRTQIPALLKLLAWASERGMTVPQLYDEIAALYVS